MQGRNMKAGFDRRCLARGLAFLTTLIGLAACTDAAPPVVVDGPPPLVIVRPPVEPGRAAAAVRDPNLPPVVPYPQPPGAPLVLPPPIPVGDRQETLVEAVPYRLVLVHGVDEHRFVRFLAAVGQGRFDALHLELRGSRRGVIGAVIRAARRAGVDPLKIRVFDVPAAGGAVEVIATRYAATAPICTSLAIVGPSANDNDFDPTLGCSIRANLAATVNDPADLLGNPAVVPADGSGAATRAVSRYRGDSDSNANAGSQASGGQAGGGNAGGSGGAIYLGGGFNNGPPGGTVLGPGGPVSQ